MYRKVNSRTQLRNGKEKLARKINIAITTTISKIVENFIFLQTLSAQKTWD